MSDGQSKRSAAPVIFGLVLVVGAVWWLYPRNSAEQAAARADEAGGQAAPWVASGAQEEARPLLRVAAQASIAGKVFDEHGQPIAGARVCAKAESQLLASSETRFARCSLSARDGHYRIEQLFGVRHRVVAGAPGFIPGPYVRGEGASRRETVELRPGQEALGIDITLQGGGVEVHGVVKDLSGGAIEGAQVMAEYAYAITGADGTFSTWVRPGNAWLEATADGYTNGRDQGTAPGHAFEIYLTPESVLIGKVVKASDGSPIEGAKVSASGGGGGGWSRSSEFTDAGGNFRIAGLEPGAYKPAAESDEAFGLAEEQVILGLGETSAPVTITAHPATYVEGTVAVPGGDSCDAGSVSLHDRANDRWAWADIASDGTVRMQGVRAGTYEVQVRCERLVSAERYPDVVVEKTPVTGVKWEVARGQSIRGLVVDGGGKPAERLTVGADMQPDPSKPRAQQTGGWGETDASGRFELAGLLPGAYKLKVHAWRPSRATPPKPLEVTLPEGKDLEDIRIELPATGEIRGKVRDPQGRPVPKLTVNLNGGAQWLSTLASDDGTFKFEHVAVGEYRVLANRGWSETMRAPGTGDDDVQGTRVAVRSGSVEEVELVVEEASGTITGVVRDADGGPVADAFIEATRESDSATKAAGSALRQGRWGNWGKAPHLTESDGRFSLEGLSKGKYTVRAHRKGGGEGVVEHVELGGDVVLTIASTGRMSGSVALRGGGAPEEFRISVYDETTGFGRHDGFYKTGGAWSFAELPAGKYKLRVSAGGGSAEVEATMRAGEETAGVRIELAPRVTIRGKVVDEEGQPVPGVEVWIGGAAYGGGDADRKNITDQSGHFEVGNAPTGEVRISAWPNGDEFSWANVPARIEASGSSVELPPIELVRRRLKDGEESGDLGIKLKESEPGEDPLARKLVVAHVRAGGPAAAAGLQVGDEIVRIDGTEVAGANAYRYYSLTNVREGTTLTLGLARGVDLRVVAGKKP